MRHILVGTVCSGRQQATEHLRQHAQELQRCLGATPVPGTLNIVLQRPVGLDFQQCRLVCGKHFFWTALAAGIPALAYRWPGCPLHIVEIVAPITLRMHLGADDGDQVSIAVEGTSALRLPQYLAWLMLWGSRQDRFYKSNDYPRLKCSKRLAKHASQASMSYAVAGFHLSAPHQNRNHSLVCFKG